MDDFSEKFCDERHKVLDASVDRSWKKLDQIDKKLVSIDKNILGLKSSSDTAAVRHENAVNQLNGKNGLGIYIPKSFFKSKIFWTVFAILFMYTLIPAELKIDAFKAVFGFLGNK